MMPIVWIVAGILVFFIFLAGFNKGYRRISRSNLYKLLAGVGFLFVYDMLWDKNVFENAFSNNPILASGLWAIALAIGCALVLLLCYGAITALFKPKTDAQNTYFALEEGIEYDDDVSEEDASKKPRIKKKKYKPSFLGRLSGGVFCTLNVALGLAMIAAVAFVVVYCTKFADTGSLREFYQSKSVKELTEKYLAPYTLDVVGVGVIFWFAFMGYKNGFVGTLWSILKNVGLLCVIGVCIAAPFLGQFAELKLMQQAIEKAQKLLEKVPESFRGIVAKVAVGVVLAIIAGILLFILNRILLAIADQIDDIPFFRAIDGGLAAIVYALFGVLVCVVFWTILYAVDYCGYLDLVKILGSDKPTLSQNLLLLVDKYLSKYADKYLAKFAK